jgi:hypothetical protein
MLVNDMTRCISIFVVALAMSSSLAFAADVMDDISPGEEESVLDAVILWEFDTEA